MDPIEQFKYHDSLTIDLNNTYLKIIDDDAYFNVNFIYSNIETLTITCTGEQKFKRYYLIIGSTGYDIFHNLRYIFFTNNVSEVKIYNYQPENQKIYINSFNKSNDFADYLPDIDDLDLEFYNLTLPVNSKLKYRPEISDINYDIKYELLELIHNMDIDDHSKFVLSQSLLSSHFHKFKNKLKEVELNTIKNNYIINELKEMLNIG